MYFVNDFDNIFLETSITGCESLLLKPHCPAGVVQLLVKRTPKSSAVLSLYTFHKWGQKLVAVYSFQMLGQKLATHGHAKGDFNCKNDIVRHFLHFYTTLSCSMAH